MITLINRLTGTEMRVTEERLEKYLAAGHKLAAKDASSNAPDENLEEIKAEEAEVKTSKRRRRRESR